MEAKNEHADLAASESINVHQSSNGDHGGSGELEKIRSILFGEQIRSTEDRLSRLEDQLMAKMAEAHKAIETRLDALEEKLEDRSKDIGDLKSGLKSQRKEIDSDLKKIDEALRETIVSAASTVAHDFETKTDALSQALEDSLGQVQKEKVNRKQLSDLLSQMAQSLDK